MILCDASVCYFDEETQQNTNSLNFTKACFGNKNVANGTFNFNDRYFVQK